MEAYLDHASTTPVRPEALAAMLPFLTEHYGNPSSQNAPGRCARASLDESREIVAGALGCRPGEVIFCSGGTEAANAAVFGAVAAARADGRTAARTVTAVCSAVEHHAVLRAVESVGGETVPVDRDAVVDLDALETTVSLPDSLNDSAVGSPALVAVMLANNEVGTVEPVDAVAEVVRRSAPGASVLVDAVHAVPWLDVASACAVADMIVVSAHKFGGPKGVGALVVRRGTPFEAPGRGGSQERERRPGTENVAGIAGMAAALEATTLSRATVVSRVASMRDRLARSICSSVPGVTETVAGRSSKVAGSCHLLVDGVEQEELLFLLDRDGVHASAGSACASGAMEPSHVLDAMGIDLADPPRAALRLSLGHATTEAEVDYASAVVPKVIESLRRA